MAELNQDYVNSPRPQKTESSGSDYQAMAAPQAPSISGADPNQSPAYLSFLRGAGLEESQAKAAVTRQKANLQAQLEAQRPVWAQTLEQGLGRVLNNAAMKGTVRSGRRLEDQALVQQDVGRQQAAFESGIADKQATLEEELQSRLLGLQRGRADAELSARQSVYETMADDYQTNLTSYYLQQLLGGMM